MELTLDWTRDLTNSEQQNLTAGTFVLVSDIIYIICRMNGSDQKDLSIPSFLQEQSKAFPGIKRGFEDLIIELL